MSQFAVRNNDDESISSEKINTELSSHADAEEPLADRLRRRARERGQERVEAVHVVEMVVQRLDRLPRRRTIGELQRAEPTLDLIRRRQRGQDVRSDSLGCLNSAHRPPP